MSLFVASLTTALIVNTWLQGDSMLFTPLHQRLNTWAGQGNGVQRIFARGALCRYCLTHWVGAAVTILMLPDWRWMAAVIFLANVAISVFQAIGAARDYLMVKASR
jgi:hypothetical protein